MPRGPLLAAVPEAPLALIWERSVQAACLRADLLKNKNNAPPPFSRGGSPVACGLGDALFSNCRTYQAWLAAPPQSC